MTEWNLRPRSRSCHACGAEFPDGGKCHSAVAAHDAPALLALVSAKTHADAQTSGAQAPAEQNLALQTPAAAQTKAQAAPPSSASAKKQDYLRLDFCPACWAPLASLAAEPASGLISAWQSAYSAPEAAAPEPLPKETAESLLRRMLEHGGDEATPAVIFLLAVMLERKRILIERGVRRAADGSLTRIYERRKTGEVMLIPDPGLDAAQIPEAQRQIDLLLTPP